MRGSTRGYTSHAIKSHVINRVTIYPVKFFSLPNPNTVAIS